MADGRKTLPELERGDLRKFEKNGNIGVSNPKCKIRRNLHVYPKSTQVEHGPCGYYESSS